MFNYECQLRNDGHWNHLNLKMNLNCCWFTWILVLIFSIYYCIYKTWYMYPWHTLVSCFESVIPKPAPIPHYPYLGNLAWKLILSGDRHQACQLCLHFKFISVHTWYRLEKLWISKPSSATWYLSRNGYVWRPRSFR